jgi:hypothetical protein
MGELLRQGECFIEITFDIDNCVYSCQVFGRTLNTLHTTEEYHLRGDAIKDAEAYIKRL